MYALLKFTEPYTCGGPFSVHIPQLDAEGDRRMEPILCMYVMGVFGISRFFCALFPNETGTVFLPQGFAYVPQFLSGVGCRGVVDYYDDNVAGNLNARTAAWPHEQA